MHLLKDSSGTGRDFQQEGDPLTGAAYVKISGSVSLNPDVMSFSQANYVAITGGTGYSIGDQITATIWWDMTTPANPAFLVAAFYNWETNLEISPNMAHLQQTGGDAITATEYAATIGKVRIAPLTSDTPSSVASSASSVTLIAANANRRSLTIFNNSTAILYVCHGATATQAGAKEPIGAGGFYEMTSPVYVGEISGIWASANGNASIYEGV